MTRISLKQHASAQYDVAIIGGGINGAGVARELALRGIKAIVLEKGDFGSGTSSASSKLIHGGLRYLENLELRLVYEALKERRRLLQNAPHLVKPLEFFIPKFKWDPMPKWKWRVGLSLYDLLSLNHAIHPHAYRNKSQSKKLVPHLQGSDLTGGFTYWDAQMDDARLCLECLLQAHQWGAAIVNYAEVTKLNIVDQSVHSIEVYDHVEQAQSTITASVIINAAGPWCDEVLATSGTSQPTLIKPSQGIHLVTRQIEKDRAILITSPSDHRIFFILPWHGCSLIGTTDTPFSGKCDTMTAQKDEIGYLLNQTNQVLNSPLKLADIYSIFVGLRPLARQSEAKLSKVSREHQFKTAFSNLISVFGGKYTTFRSIAESLAKTVIETHFSQQPFLSLTASKRLFGAQFQDWPTFKQMKADDIAFKVSLPQDAIDHLVDRYGSSVDAVVALIAAHPELAEPLPGTNYVKADVVYAIRTEFAQTIEDFMRRRTSLMLLPQNGTQCLDAVAAIFAQEFQWRSDRLRQEKAAYLKAVENVTISGCGFSI